MADIEKVIKAIDICLGHGKCNDCSYHSGANYSDQNCRGRMLQDALELLKEQQKKEIKLIKKHTFSLGRADEFSMRKLYEVICETLMDEGQLIISRTDDYEKVNFVWEIRPEET